MKNLRHILMILAGVFVIVACQEEETSNGGFLKEQLSGFVQKGPFNNGSSILISELNWDYTQTGKNVTSRIENDQGYYEIDNIDFVSPYVSIQASGFYFDEVSGYNSHSQLTLYGISDLTDKNSLNVNVLSHLEKPRVEYLLDHGHTFQEAKDQALNEIFEIFKIDEEIDGEAEKLNITGGGAENAVLLAISSILQGGRSHSSLSLLLADISTDIKTDGTLDDPSLKIDIMEEAKELNLSGIKDNLSKYYADMGEEFSCPEFEKYVTHYLENAEFGITYPKAGQHGANLLYQTGGWRDTLYTDQDYSLAAQLSEGASLKILFHCKGINYDASSAMNWNISQSTQCDTSYVFQSEQAGMDCDVKIRISPKPIYSHNMATVEFYELNADKPVKEQKFIILSE
jgi:hypothetical protein